MRAPARRNEPHPVKRSSNCEPAALCICRFLAALCRGLLPALTSLLLLNRKLNEPPDTSGSFGSGESGNCFYFDHAQQATYRSNGQPFPSAPIQWHNKVSFIHAGPSLKKAGDVHLRAQCVSDCILIVARFTALWSVTRSLSCVHSFEF